MEKLKSPIGYLAWQKVRRIVMPVRRRAGLPR